MKAKSPSTHLKELFAHSDCLPPLVVITSQDLIRRQRAIKFISNTLAGKKLSLTTLTLSDAPKDSIRGFINKLKEPSLFEPTQVGLLRNIEKAKAADIEPITKFLGQLPPGVFLYLVGADLPNSQTFKRAIAAHHIAFEPLKGAELGRWTEREFHLQGVEGCTDELVDYVIALAEGNPDKISSAIEKYALYLDGTPASRSTLQEVFPLQGHASDFDVAESILTAPRVKSEILLQRILEQGSSPYMIMGLLGKTWSSLFGICALNERGLSGNEIRSHLGLSPWLFNKYLPLTKRLTTGKVAESIEALLEADFRLKDRSLGADVVLSALAKRLHSAQKR